MHLITINLLNDNIVLLEKNIWIYCMVSAKYESKRHTNNILYWWGRTNESNTLKNFCKRTKFKKGKKVNSTNKAKTILSAPTRLTPLNSRAIKDMLSRRDLWSFYFLMITGCQRYAVKERFMKFWLFWRQVLCYLDWICDNKK